MIKMLALMVIVLMISSAGALASYNIAKYFSEKDIEINSYLSCIENGGEIIESNPLSCKDQRGNVFFKLD